MRSLVLVILALACPVGMCLIPMLLMRRHGDAASCHDSNSPDQESQLRGDAERLRAELEASRKVAAVDPVVLPVPVVADLTD